LKKTEKKKPVDIDILGISRAAFERYAKETTTEIFVTSIYRSKDTGGIIVRIRIACAEQETTLSLLRCNKNTISLY
jgi:hypothetical protein